MKRKLNHTKATRYNAATNRASADDPDNPTSCEWCLHKHKELGTTIPFISKKCENTSLMKEENSFFKDRKKVYSHSLMRKPPAVVNQKHPGIYQVKGCPLCCGCDSCQDRVERPTATETETETHTRTTSSPLLLAVCHCGQVNITIAAPMTSTVTSCNCSLCHTYGHICAYFKESEVAVAGVTDTYVHGDKMISFHRCKNCGCHTHWTSIDESSLSDRMAVNARLFPRELLTQARVRHFDGFNSWEMRDTDSPFVREDIGCNIDATIKL
jgi:hypothetical protein